MEGNLGFQNVQSLKKRGGGQGERRVGEETQASASGRVESALSPALPRRKQTNKQTTKQTNQPDGRAAPPVLGRARPPAARAGRRAPGPARTASLHPGPARSAAVPPGDLTLLAWPWQSRVPASQPPKRLK